VTYTITEQCVDIKDKTCIDECPVDCIYEGERMLYIHPDECVDCGACEPVCPVEAIHYEDDVPEQWAHYTDQRGLLCRAGLARRCVQGRHDPQRPAAGQVSAAAGRERLTRSGIPMAWASAIGKSLNVIDGRSAGQPEIESLSWC
jgi:NAD-dependent dihydropyrimidine dehydrogenase PreA subunit